MKKLFLILSLVTSSMSSLFAMEGPTQYITINQPAFEFIMECQAFLKDGYNDGGRLKQIGVLYNNSRAEITAGLGSVDCALGYLDFSQPTQEMIHDLRDILGGKAFNIASGEYLLELGQSFLTCDVKRLVPVKESTTPVPMEENSLSVLVFNSPFFKASCTATVAGVVTYCALRLYNKDKAKEHQYSPIKWSLGAAVVVGAGTYLSVR